MDFNIEIVLVITKTHLLVNNNLLIVVLANLLNKFILNLNLVKLAEIENLLIEIQTILSTNLLLNLPVHDHANHLDCRLINLSLQDIPKIHRINQKQ